MCRPTSSPRHSCSSGGGWCVGGARARERLGLAARTSWCVRCLDEVAVILTNFLISVQTLVCRPTSSPRRFSSSEEGRCVRGVRVKARLGLGASGVACCGASPAPWANLSGPSFFFFITLGLELSATKVYEPEIRALLETASHYSSGPLSCDFGTHKARFWP